MTLWCLSGRPRKRNGFKCTSKQKTEITFEALYDARYMDIEITSTKPEYLTICALEVYGKEALATRVLFYID